MTTSGDAAPESFAQKMWKVGRMNSTLINFLLVWEERGVGSKDREGERTLPSPAEVTAGTQQRAAQWGTQGSGSTGGEADDIWIHPAKPVTGLHGGRDHSAVGLWCMHGEQGEERA